MFIRINFDAVFFDNYVTGFSSLQKKRLHEVRFSLVDEVMIGIFHMVASLKQLQWRA